MGPIFEANLSAIDTVSAFQGLFEAASVEGSLTDLSGKLNHLNLIIMINLESIPSLAEVLFISTGNSTSQSDESNAIALKFNTFAVLLYTIL